MFVVDSNVENNTNDHVLIDHLSVMLSVNVIQNKNILLPVYKAFNTKNFNLTLIDRPFENFEKCKCNVFYF